MSIMVRGWLLKTSGIGCRSLVLEWIEICCSASSHVCPVYTSARSHQVTSESPSLLFMLPSCCAAVAVAVPYVFAMRAPCCA
jgi:hypothetical protein